LEKEVYVDVLLGTNLIINYLLLLASAKLSNVRIVRWRIAVASVVGSLYSLTIFLNLDSLVLLIMIKLISAASIVLIAFAYRDVKLFLRSIFIFFSTSFILAGGMLALWFFVTPPGLIVNNSVIYFDVSPVTLIALTVAVYGGISLLSLFLSKRKPAELTFRVTIRKNNQTVTLPAFLDTGNNLREPFSGRSVIVCREQPILPLFSAEDRTMIERGDMPHGFRIIPYNFVMGRGIMPAFLCSEVIIEGIESRITRSDIYIAIAKQKFVNGEFDALLGLSVMENIGGFKDG
jgi:stage II sporulation protein GA (sporulation sigma-E factor processing peptidase)